MANPFDQFDTATAAGQGPAQANPFDAFDPGKSGQPMPEFLFQQGPRASILDAFGQGAAQGWGGEPLGLSDESADALKKAGIFNDLDQGHQNLLRTFNEAMIRPAAAGLDAIWRGGAAALRGTQAAIENIGERAEAGGLPGATALARDIAALPEAFPRGVAEIGLPTPPTPIERISPEATAEAVRALTPPDLAQARSLGVVGEGETGWKGVPEPIPAETETAREAAARQLQETAPPEGPSPAIGQSAEPPPPDIHQIARQIAPDTFRQYDALTTRQDTYRRWLNDLAETRQQTAEATAPGAAEIADLQDRLAGPEAAGRRAANWQSRLDALLPDRDAYIADQVSRDSPDMARVRQALQEDDYRMRDLAEPVSAAYRQAQEQIPPVIPEVQEPLVPTAPAPPAEAPALAAEEAPAPLPAPSRVVPNIHDDVYQQLVAAGRPIQEADAAAALVAAHYDARAARFGGTLGSAADLYGREAPVIEAAPGTGAIRGQTVLRDGQATIRLMGHADASTFIHETGHGWLEELMRDAADERAPEDLRADAASVRSWLGIGEADTIPTRGHEKFARGFERYMMEGVAPSPKLAGVFDQFKQWLTRIYQTVSRLRSPITDDIRDVFSRLIALPGREPVIAGDMTISEDFAREHETLAERTSPEVAAGTADRLRAEADRVALEKAPEVYDELSGSAGTSRETRGDEAANIEPDRNGPATGPRPGAPRALEPVGAERPRGGEAAEQGPGVAAGSDPATTFPRSGESPYVDRAGNIRLDLLGTPADVSQVIRDAASENNEFLGSRRGVISDAEVLRLADALGMDASELNRRRLGQAFNAEQVTAARKLLVQSATAVRDAAQKAAAGTDEDLLAYAAAKDRHRMIQGQVSGVTAEAGRALRAFGQGVSGTEEAAQIGRFLEEATGRTLNQLRKEAAKITALDTPSKISKVLADSEKKPGLFDWFESSFINGLISGTMTHGTYAVANAQLALFKATVETAFQAAVGAVREQVGTGRLAGPQNIQLGEIPAQLYGAIKGQRDGWRAAWDAARTNQTIPLPGEKLSPGYAFSRGQIIPGPIGTVIESPQRMIAAIHTLTRVTSERMYRSAQAYRGAMQEGLSGEKFAARVAYLEANPTEEMQQAGIVFANENALMQRAPYSSLTSILQRATNLGIHLPEVPLPGGQSFPLGTLRPFKFIDPFVAISSNILKGAILERSPVGLLSPRMWQDLSGRNGTLAFDRAAGRMLAGTSFYIMAGGLAAEGLITGSAPDDYRKAMVKKMTGWRPHSVLIDNMYHSANRLGILGMQTGIAADLWDVAHLASTEDFATAAAAASHAFSQNILDESFMRGPSDFLRALTEHERYGAGFVRQFLSSTIPFSVGLSQIARTIDPYTRQARTITDAMLRKIPWGSETLYPMRDIWGEPMPNDRSLVPGALAIYESRINNDPVNQRLDALDMGPSLPERKIRGVQLTDSQYDDYARIAGRMAKLQLDRIVPSPGFSQMPETVQREVIQKTISGAREVARTQVMIRNPEIINQAMAGKTAALHARQ